MSIDLTKPVQTRNGLKARILCTNRIGGLYPIIGLVVTENGTEETRQWTCTGCDIVGGHCSPHDLINVLPPKKKVMVEVRLWKDCDGIVRSSSNVMHTGHEWPSDEPTPWLSSTTIEMEYEEQS